MWRIIKGRNTYNRKVGIGYNLMINGKLWRCYCFNIKSGKTVYNGPEQINEKDARKDAKKFISLQEAS